MEIGKQEIQQVGKLGKKEKEDIDNQILKYKSVMGSYVIEISSMEQQLFALQQQLEDAKAHHQTNCQELLVLQTKKKSICENALNLLERGKKGMQSNASLQSKHDETLIQQASLKS